MTIIPAPPGYAVALQRPQARRFADPNIANQYVIGLFDRGTVSQINGPALLDARFGESVAYSGAHAEVLAAFAEGANVVTVARVTGPDAEAAARTLNDDAGTPAPSITVTAVSPGQWGNSLEVAVVEVVADESVKLVITENDVAVAVSPTATTVAELVAWSQSEVLAGTAVVTVTAVGTVLPAVAAAAALTGGDDDRAAITVTDYEAALALLDPRYGPGVVRVAGAYDEDIHEAVIDHCESTGRIAFLDLEEDATESEALEHSLSLEANKPDECFRASLWNQWADAQVITGDPDKTVPYSALQSGIHARVLTEFGVGTPAFGERRGRSRSASRLTKEWTTGYDPAGEVQSLYAGHVNVAVDTGASIQALGYRTLDRDNRREDIHVATTLMWLQWEGAKLARSYLGEPIDQATLIAYEQDLDGLCEFLLKKRAIVSLDDERGIADGGRIIDVQRFNTLETMQARQLHGFVRIRPTGSVHWVDLTVGTAAYTERLGV